MKQEGAEFRTLDRVAPHAGAWIETMPIAKSQAEIGSPPTRGRGLKLAVQRCTSVSWHVAPHAGAWIETKRWVSTSSPTVSPPTRGRGLKHVPVNVNDDSIASPPTRGRGLKLKCRMTRPPPDRRPPRGGVD